MTVTATVTAAATATITDSQLAAWKQLAGEVDPLDRTAAEVAILKLIALLEQERRNRFVTDSGKTHWPGCYIDHYRCAMQRIAELEESMPDQSRPGACPVLSMK